MKLLGLASGVLIGLCSVASAQDCVGIALSAIPPCAQSCFLNGAPSVGCGGTDFVCQCEQEARLYAAVEGCVSTGCPAASFQAVIDGASTVCNCAIGGSSPITGLTDASRSFASSPPNTVVNTIVPNTVVGQTVIGITPPKTTSAAAVPGGGSTTKRVGTDKSPLATPTIPSITIATNASSWATRQIGLPSGLFGIVLAATAWTIIALW